MIFRVYEHYDINDQNNKYNNDKTECFICFESESTDNHEIINLKEQTICIKNCLCNGTIHVECLKRWIDINSSCPLCRNKVFKMDKIIFIIQRYPYFYINIYLCIKQFSIRFVRILTFFILLYMTTDYFLTNFIFKIDPDVEFRMDDFIIYSYTNNSSLIL